MKPSTILVIFSLICFQSSQGQILELEDGAILGTIMQTRKGVNFNAFFNIPFAQPPIGNLRFQPPLRNTNWQGVLNATSPGPTCFQNLIISEYGRSEDCLQLNVYTKNLALSNLKPVIVFFHGGGFERGSGVQQQPIYLMDRDVVVVTTNYRVGPLGFLATGTEEATGNMGLKDQSFALRWIQRNIARFGGDPQSVTIAGLSAGAHSVTGHMVSPMSKGLFHKVIALSGGITWQTGLRINADIERAKYVAANLDCSTNVDEIVECLKGVRIFN